MTKKEQQLTDKLNDLTADLQRQRADFENYRKRVETEKDHLRSITTAATIMKLLPIIDDIERAVAHTPAELQGNKWAQGIAGLVKNLDKALQNLGLTRINATSGTPFNPSLHEAVMMDEAEGDQEVIAEELRAGYQMNGQVVRPSMVKVTKK